jgi:hypothetical protein
LQELIIRIEIFETNHFCIGIEGDWQRVVKRPLQCTALDIERLEGVLAVPLI